MVYKELGVYAKLTHKTYEYVDGSRILFFFYYCSVSTILYRYLILYYLGVSKNWAASKVFSIPRNIIFNMSMSNKGVH